jgi:hypothetical protein
MNLRKEIGPAVWLLVLLWLYTPEKWDGVEWAAISNGDVVSDKGLGALLDAQPVTVASWRRRLKRAGLLDWLVKPGVGRQLFVKGFHQIFGAHPAAEQPAAAAKPAAGTQAKAQAKPAAAPWVH